MADLNLPTADVDTSTSTSTRAKAPAYLNIGIPVQNPDGTVSTVMLPVGCALDPTGASYSDKTFVSAAQKRLMQMLIDMATKANGKLEFDAKADFTVQLVGVKSEVPAQEFALGITLK